MSDLSVCDTEELEARAEKLLDELDPLLREVGPVMEKIGRLQNELMIIKIELDGRREDEQVPG